MIAHLSGLLFDKSPESVIIDAQGVGYEVYVPLSTFYQLPEKNETIRLKIYTHVREDTLTLFGFNTKLEKDLFMMLISVSGIGPKLGVNILSGMGPQDLLEAIASGDAPRLQGIPGVGKKTAERMVLELKDRALKSFDREKAPTVQVEAARDDGIVEDAVSALSNLGYSPKLSKAAIEKAIVSVEIRTLENVIREALRVLA